MWYKFLMHNTFDYVNSADNGLNTLILMLAHLTFFHGTRQRIALDCITPTCSKIWCSKRDECAPVFVSW